MTRPSRPTLTSVGALGAALVLAGGLVTSPLPASSWAAQLALRDSMPGRMLGLATVVTGMALMTLAWVALWRAAGAGTLPLAAVRRATATWCGPLLLAPPLFSRDGWSYVAQGELTRIGFSPYVWGPGILDGPLVENVDPRWLWTPTPYGPLPLLFGSGAASLLRDPWALVVAHRLLALVGLALLAWALPRLAAWTGRDAAFVSALVLPSPLVLAHGVGGLHNDLLMVGLAAAALAMTSGRAWVLGAVLGGLAAAVKVPGGLVCVGVALASLPLAAPLTVRLRRFGSVGAVSATTLVGVGSLAGVGVGWVHALGVPGTVRTPLSVSTLLEHVIPGARTLGTVLAVGIVCWIALRTTTGSPAHALGASAAALTATVLLSPVVQPWYVLWCVPFVALLPLRRRELAVLVWVSLALGVAAPLDSSLRGAYLLVVGSALVLAWTVRPSVLPVLRSPHLQGRR